MIKKEITICGKKVNVTYCYATEIEYNTLADENVSSFIDDVAIAYQNDMLDNINPHKTLNLITATIKAYYEYEGVEPPLKEKDLLYEASAKEIALAVATIIKMYTEFYKLPSSEATDEKEEKTSKKRKKKNA